MTRAELKTIIGLLEKIEDKRLTSGRMWDGYDQCYCAQGAICPKQLWSGRYTLALGADEFVNEGVEAWAKTQGLSAEALCDLMGINDNMEAYSPEERYGKVMAALRGMLE